MRKTLGIVFMFLIGASISAQADSYRCSPEDARDTVRQYIENTAARSGETVSNIHIQMESKKLVAAVLYDTELLGRRLQMFGYVTVSPSNCQVLRSGLGGI